MVTSNIEKICYGNIKHRGKSVMVTSNIEKICFGHIKHWEHLLWTWSHQNWCSDKVTVQLRSHNLVFVSNQTLPDPASRTQLNLKVRSRAQATMVTQKLWMIRYAWGTGRSFSLIFGKLKPVRQPASFHIPSEDSREPWRCWIQPSCSRAPQRWWFRWGRRWRTEEYSRRHSVSPPRPVSQFRLLKNIKRGRCAYLVVPITVSNISKHPSVWPFEG